MMHENSIQERESKSQKSSFSYEVPQDMEDQFIEGTPKVVQSFPRKKKMENIQENYEEFQSAKIKHLFTQKQYHQDNQQTSCRFISLMRTDKFIQKFKNNILMNSYIFPQHLIDQLRSKYPKDFKRNKIKQSVHSNNELLLFRIDSRFLMIWDVISTLSNFFIMWNTPYQISFGEGDASDVVKLIETIILVILTLTMFVNLNRAIIVEGQEITNRQIIVKRYVQTQFLFDLIIPILLFVPRNFILELLGLFKIMAAYQNLQNYFVHKLELTYFQGNTQGNVLDLIIMIFQICFYNHLMACIFHFVGRNTEYLGRTWITERGLEDESPSHRYVYAFYWATMTMTTVGYGDITAQNEIETLISSIIMLTSTCVFAYSMNSIGIILKDIYDSKIKEKQQKQNQFIIRLLLLSINAYMKKNQVDFGLQNRIRNYIQFFAYQLNKKNDEDSQSIIQQLPLSLKEELQNDISEKIINKQEWLVSHFSLSAQRELSKNLELMKIIPGDYVIKQGDQTNLDLYFIQDGELQVLEEQTQMKFEKLTKNSTVGQLSFFTGQPSRITVKSTTYTELYKIARSDFLKIIESNRKDFEIYHYIKDQLIFNNQYHLINSKCEICQMYTHQAIDCPYIQYKPDLEQRLKKSMFKSSINLRKRYKRKIQQKTDYHLEEIRSSVKIFQQERGEDEPSLTQLGPSQQRVFDSGQYEETMQVRKCQPKVSIIPTANVIKQVIEISYFGYSMTLDKMANFKNYFPYNNIRKIATLQQNTIHNIENYSKYTFKYFVKLAAAKFYQKIRKQRKSRNIQFEQM